MPVWYMYVYVHDTIFSVLPIPVPVGIGTDTRVKTVSVLPIPRTGLASQGLITCGAVHVSIMAKSAIAKRFFSNIWSIVFNYNTTGNSHRHKKQNFPETFCFKIRSKLSNLFKFIVDTTTERKPCNTGIDTADSY